MSKNLRFLLAINAFVFFPALALGQPPYGGQRLRNDSPRARRAAREACVAAVGETARPLIEAHGEHAVHALRACSVQVARKVAEFHNGGTLEKLAKPDDLLDAIARAGDDAALWAIGNSKELADADALAAFCHGDPLLYALGIEPISKGAAEWRARRLSGQAGPAGEKELLGPREWGFVGAGAVLAGAALWLLRRRPRP